MEILVVVSKIKKMIKAEVGMSTSASSMDALSTIVHRECMKAAERAKQNGRKTIMDRDFEE